jgi:hypothetical protein
VRMRVSVCVSVHVCSCCFASGGEASPILPHYDSSSGRSVSSLTNMKREGQRPSAGGTRPVLASPRGDRQHAAEGHKAKSGIHHGGNFTDGYCAEE